MFSYTMQRLLHPIKRKFSFGTISNKRFLGAFCWKIWLFVYIPQQQNQVYSSTAGPKKWEGRQGSHALCGGCCTQPKESSPLEPFRIRDFLVHFAGKYCYLCTYRSSKIKFTPQPQEQKSGRRQTPCSSTLCRC